MTCIAAITNGEQVWMGGDAAATRCSRKYVLPRKKVWISGEFIIGVAGLASLSQTLHYTFDLPPLEEGQTIESWLTGTLPKAIRNCPDFKTEKTEHHDIEGEILIGHRGRLFHYDVSLAWGEATDYEAIGSGGEFALGALHVLGGERRTENPVESLIAALEAASTHAVGVAPPFTILSV